MRRPRDPVKGRERERVEEDAVPCPGKVRDPMTRHVIWLAAPFSQGMVPDELQHRGGRRMTKH